MWIFNPLLKDLYPCVNFSFEVLQSALPQSARRNASSEGKMACEPKQRFLAEPLKQTALVVTRGRMPERRLLVLSQAGHWDTTLYWDAREIAGALEVEGDGGEQTPSRITQTPGCENGLNRLIAGLAVNFLGWFFFCVCWNSL